MSRQEGRANRPSMQIDMNSIRQGATGISNEDLRVWELASNVPALMNIWAYVCFLLNVILPGTGTMLSACLGDANINKTQLVIGLVQLMTSVYLLGWLISIYWGYLLVKKSKGNHDEIKQLMSAAGGSREGQSPNAGAATSSVNNSASAAGTYKKKQAMNPYEDL